MMNSRAPLLLVVGALAMLALSPAHAALIDGFDSSDQSVVVTAAAPASASDLVLDGAVLGGSRHILVEKFADSQTGFSNAAVAEVTGGLLSMDKTMPAVIRRLHQVTPYLTVLSTAATLYLLSRR